MNHSEQRPDFFLNDSLSFEQRMAELFAYQVQWNPVYQRYCSVLGWSIEHKQDITTGQKLPPFLPVEAFKDATVLCTPPASHAWYTPQKDPLFFQSSGTQAMQRSKHVVLDPLLYTSSIREAWSSYFGKDNWIIWAYTPGYQNNPHSSLLYMINHLMQQDHTRLSRYLSLHEPLDLDELEQLHASGHQVMLFGAAFGWLDLIERHEALGHTLKLPPSVKIMETGGMKTFRRAISRQQLYHRLIQGFGLEPHQLVTEYGMTECLSQAYTSEGMWLTTPHWMRILVVDPSEPHRIMSCGEEGRIAIVDLANVHSCSFLLTSDRGISDASGAFQVLGRLEASQLRGCNFLVEQDG